MVLLTRKMCIFPAGNTLFDLLNNTSNSKDLYLTRNAEHTKKNQRILQNAERLYCKDRLQNILDSVDDGISLVGLDGKFIDTNKASLKQLKMAKEELIGKNVYDIVFPEDRARAIEGSFKVLETGKTVNQVRVMRKDGSWFFAEISTTLICDENNKPSVFLGVTRDISERKKIEEALRESEQLYKTIFDNSDDAFQLVKLQYDEVGQPLSYMFLKVNKAFERLTGRNSSEIVGKQVEAVYPNVEPYWINLYGNIVRTGKSIHQETYHRDLDRWFDVYAFPYAKDQVAALFRDITSRKNLERQLQEKERMAAIGETAGMVGHDLRNPLQSIVSDLYLAQTELKTLPEGQLKVSLNESIQDISEQITYMDKIVSDLQTFVKPIEALKQIVDIKELVESTVEHIDLPSSIQSVLIVEDNLKVVTDPQLLRRVLINLITNAIQAMPDGGKLTIHSSNDGNGHVNIRVEDTGIGIPDDVKPKIFTPLFTTKSKGQGFGLAVCKRTIEAQGGSISFDSQVGKGTQFTVELPLYHGA